jgi:hypothetical protein
LFGQVFERTQVNSEYEMILFEVKNTWVFIHKVECANY